MSDMVSGEKMAIGITAIITLGVLSIILAVSARGAYELTQAFKYGYEERMIPGNMSPVWQHVDTNTVARP